MKILRLSLSILLLALIGCATFEDRESRLVDLAIRCYKNRQYEKTVSYATQAIRATSRTDTTRVACQLEMAHLIRGIAYTEFVMTWDAEYDFKKVLEINPSNQLAIKWLDFVKTLEADPNMPPRPPILENEDAEKHLVVPKLPCNKIDAEPLPSPRTRSPERRGEP